VNKNVALVDSHTHLDHVDDLEGVLTRAKEAGISKIVTIGTSLESSKKAIEIADSTSSVRLRSGLRGAKENFPEIYATVGLHPKDAKQEIEQFGLLSCFKTGKQLAQSSNKVVAIGECGLDYYLGFRGQAFGSEAQTRRGLGTSDEEKKIQRELFIEQIKLADELKLPLVIHCRNGWEEIFDLIDKRGRTSLGVFHSWTGDWKATKRALDLGFYISFSGIVTFTNASAVQSVAKKIPIDRILIETDSPYLAPEPMRGSTNEPKNVKIIAQFIADLRNQTVDEISSKTSANARKLFNLL